jgi:hypothetical protein
MVGAFSIIIERDFIIYYFYVLYLKLVFKFDIMLYVNFFKNGITCADGFLLWSKVIIERLRNLIF